jgi:putative oxidoreductase
MLVMLTSIQRLIHSVLGLLTRTSWLGPLAVRLVIGLAFAVTGWGKLHNLEQVTEYFTTLHIPAPGLQAAFVSSVELIGGLLLIVGLGTRIAAAFLIGVMTVATLTAKLPEAEHLIDLISTIELTYLAIFVWLVVSGAGKASIDHVIARRGHADHQVGEAA